MACWQRHVGSVKPWFWGWLICSGLIIGIRRIDVAVSYCVSIFSVLRGSLFRYLGLKILFSKPSADELQIAQQSGNSKQALQDGFAIAFLNPKLAVFFLALFSQFIDPVNLTFQVGMIMCLTVLLIDTGWYLLVAALTELSKKRFAFTKSSPWLDKILAVVFIGLAIRVVLMV